MYQKALIPLAPRQPPQTVGESRFFRDQWHGPPAPGKGIRKVRSKKYERKLRPK